MTESVLLPEELGLKRATMADIRGGADAAASAAMVRAVLSGEPGARLDMVLLNAGTKKLYARFGCYKNANCYKTYKRFF